MVFLLTWPITDLYVHMCVFASLSRVYVLFLSTAHLYKIPWCPGIQPGQKEQELGSSHMKTLSTAKESSCTQRLTGQGPQIWMKPEKPSASTPHFPEKTGPRPPSSPGQSWDEHHHSHNGQKLETDGISITMRINFKRKKYNCGILTQ